MAMEKTAIIVNPIRSRELWKDKTTKPLDDQYRIIKENGLKATWLIQNDVLSDKEIMDKIINFNDDQEIGIFLEVSKNLAIKSRVYFEEQKPWYDPGVVFLSGYDPKERAMIIDKMMSDFKQKFGYFPKAVGAWWIDSVSLNYLENKYGIKNAMIVTDQKTTDNYGIWGQWWGYPYHPDTSNILVPGKMNVLITQWALRDPEKAFFGSGPKVSNFSMQANDYISQGLKIDYFEKLANIYFDERNKLGIITVGLETGLESVDFIDEYKKQLDWIKENNIETFKMTDLSIKYDQLYNGNPKEIFIGNWLLTPTYRENVVLGEKINYQHGWYFKDHFKKDSQSFLNRIYNQNNLMKKPINWLWLGGLIGFLIVKKLKKKWWIAVVGLIIWFGLIHLRYTKIEEVSMIGVLIDNFRFIGINSSFKIINQDLENLIAKSMLKLKIGNSELIWWLLVGIIIGKIHDLWNLIVKRKLEI